MDYIEAALTVLKGSKRPMTAKEIVDEAMARVCSPLKARRQRPPYLLGCTSMSVTIRSQSLSVGQSPARHRHGRGAGR
jgi:HB1, ASXL, restriction endonuclease HTH domain